MRTRQPGRPGGGRDRRPRDQHRAPGRTDREHLYGRNAALECLRAGRRRVSRVYLLDGARDDERVSEIIARSAESSVPIERVSRDRLDSLVPGNHQGVVIEATRYPYAEHVDLPALAHDHAAVLALDGLEDPQNLGSLLRTAEATGVGLVVIPADRAAHVTPAVVNASSGAVEHLSIALETNLARWLERARDAGFWVVGMAGEPEATPLFNTSMKPPIVLVVGSEGEGLRRLVRERCDVLVSLPMRGHVASLNAAVAGSVGLYEIVRDAEESLNE